MPCLTHCPNFTLCRCLLQPDSGPTTAYPSLTVATACCYCLPLPADGRACLTLKAAEVRVLLLDRRPLMQQRGLLARRRLLAQQAEESQMPGEGGWMRCMRVVRPRQLKGWGGMSPPCHSSGGRNTICLFLLGAPASVLNHLTSLAAPHLPLS